MTTKNVQIVRTWSQKNSHMFMKCHAQAFMIFEKSCMALFHAQMESIYYCFDRSFSECT